MISPFYISDSKKVEIHYDDDLELKFKKHSKKELISNVNAKNPLVTSVVTILKKMPWEWFWVESAYDRILCA